MKRLLTFLFILFLPLALEARTLAVIPIYHPEVKKSAYGKLEKGIQKSLKKVPSIQSVPSKTVHKVIRENFSVLLKEELSNAWSDYYFLNFNGASDKIKGREDLDSLLLISLILNSESKNKELEETFLKILRLDPELQLDPQKYQPSIIESFEALRKNAKEKSGGKTFLKKWPKNHFVDGRLFLREVRLHDWENRFQVLAQSQGWDEILIIGIEPIGWNYKVIGQVYSVEKKNGSGRFLIELKDLADIKLAAKILVEKLTGD